MNKNKKNKGVCIITFSDNYDHQDVAFSMFNELYPKYNVYNIGLINQKNPRSPVGEHSFYYDAPRRPGINIKTFNLKVLIQIIKKINSLDVEYVYFESEHIWNAFIMMFIKKSFKIVQVIHDIIPHPDSKGKKLANKVTCKLADYVLIRNTKYKDELINKYKVKEEKIINIPLWRYYPPMDISDDNHEFLFFGRIKKYKGIDSMIEIAERCPEVKFKIVGLPDEKTRLLVDRLKKMKNVDVIDREVNDEEMEHIFRASRAVILPYESATQSGVIVDAYKYAKPVIAYDVGAITEQIDKGKSGFLIENKDIDEFVKKIKLVNEMTKNEINNFQKNAYQYGYEKYSVNKRADDFINSFLK